MFAISLIAQILIAWLLADCIAGVVHWYEDRYLDDTQSIDWLHSVANDNQLHHSKPTAMCRNTYWQNMSSAAVIAWPLTVLLVLLDAPSIITLTVFFASFANLIHRLAHEPERALPAWIRFMQWTGLFISREHHDTHHRANGRLVPKSQASIAYCPATDWVNPIVDRIRLWDRLEKVLAKLGHYTVTESVNH